MSENPLVITGLTNHLGINGFENQKDIVYAFFTVYSYVTVSRRCTRDLLRIQ